MGRFARGGFSTLGFVWLVSLSPAWAQSPPPAAPPPAYGYPPPAYGYGYPPPGYAPAGPPAPAAAAPKSDGGLLLAGKLTFGISYGVALVYSVGYLMFLYPIPGLICHASNPGTCGLDAAELWPMLPLAGPFIAASAAKNSDANTIRVAKDGPGLRTFLYGDGALQLVGAGLLIAGLATQSPSQPVTVFDVRPRPGGATLGVLGTW